MIRISCRKASRLISDSLDRPLTLPERLRLRLHLGICSRCRRFDRQLTMLRKAAATLSDKDQ